MKLKTGVALGMAEEKLEHDGGQSDAEKSGESVAGSALYETVVPAVDFVRTVQMTRLAESPRKHRQRKLYILPVSSFNVCLFLFLFAHAAVLLTWPMIAIFLVSDSHLPTFTILYAMATLGIAGVFLAWQLIK